MGAAICGPLSNEWEQVKVIAGSLPAAAGKLTPVIWSAGEVLAAMGLFLPV